MTAAGKVPPAKVLIVGAGVAGLLQLGPQRLLALWHTPLMYDLKLQSK